jgi:hypothetical protein
MLERTTVGQQWAGTCGMGLSSALASDSSSDKGNDILSKLFASSLHHIMHIYETDTLRFVAAVGEDRSVPARSGATGMCRNRHGELYEVNG